MLQHGSWVLGKQEGNRRFLDIMPRELNTGLEPGPHIGLAMDLETTGLEHEIDEVLSLGFVKFGFNDTMQITHVIEADQYFNEPETREISPLITQLTGITIDTVRGHKLTKEHWDYVWEGVEITIAHNSKFDRKFVDKNYRDDILWSCTNADLNLREKYLVPSGTLSILLAYIKDWYFGHHDALDDSWALIHILAEDDHFKQVVNKAYTPNYNVYAKNSPFEMKDNLKRKGYKWADSMKSWYWPLANRAKMLEEKEWLEELKITADVMQVSRFDRHK